MLLAIPQRKRVLDRFTLFIGIVKTPDILAFAVVPVVDVIQTESTVICPTSCRSRASFVLKGLEIEVERVFLRSGIVFTAQILVIVIHPYHQSALEIFLLDLYHFGRGPGAVPGIGDRDTYINREVRGICRTPFIRQSQQQGRPDAVYRLFGKGILRRDQFVTAVCFLYISRSVFAEIRSDDLILQTVRHAVRPDLRGAGRDCPVICRDRDIEEIDRRGIIRVVFLLDLDHLPAERIRGSQDISPVSADRCLHLRICIVSDHDRVNIRIILGFLSIIVFCIKVYRDLRIEHRIIVSDQQCELMVLQRQGHILRSAKIGIRSVIVKSSDIVPFGRGSRIHIRHIKEQHDIRILR